MRIAFSANYGVSLTVEGIRIWIDAVHNGVPGVYSPVAPDLFDRMLKSGDFREPDYLFFTHCHTDHFSKKKVERVREMWPGAGLILPEPRFSDQLLLSGRSMRFSDRGVEFQFIHLTHEGEQYRDVPHYGLLLKGEGRTVLLAGDCEGCSGQLEEALRGRHIDTAVLPFPWLTLSRGRTFVRDIIKPDHLVVGHIPFPEDDRMGYGRAAALARKKFGDTTDIRLLTRAMQTEEILPVLRP